MSDASVPLSFDDLRLLDELGDRFEAAGKAGQRPMIEAYLADVEPRLQAAAFSELLRLDLEVMRRRGEHPTPEAYAARFPLFADNVKAVFAGSRVTSRPPAGAPTHGLPSAGGSSSASTPGSAPSASPTGARFRAVRPHAQGGIGRIWVALDAELNREVALKEMLVDYAEHAEHRQRFVLEAEITGRLEHPGIVPVYGLGMAPDGRPFYAMRFIQGHSFDQAIREFHRADRLDHPYSAARILEFRRLLARFVALCNAIDFAHSRGVVHRDIKPANVMLGEYGETLVVDWGMAKVLQAAEQGSPPAGNGPAPIAGAATVEQSVFGTPQYMSPEQAAGEVQRVGPASDIYSLGATLYQLLTGVPPFPRAPLEELLAAVQRGEFPKVRQQLAAVPRPLEAICHKAMSRRPEDRYASPRRLADDLEHWLADEPVVAWPEQWPARAGRFARRHRRAVQVAGGALVLIALLTTTAALLINELRVQESRQRRRAERSEADALAARYRADEQRQAAVRAQDQAEQQRQIALEQERRARAATGFLVGVFASTDPLGLRGLGLRKVADQGTPLSPREILDRGLERLEQEPATEPLLQASLYDALGMAYFGQGELQQAEALVSRSWEIRRARLPDQHPDMLASKWSRSLFLIVHSRMEEAERLLGDVLAGQQAAADTPPLSLATTQFYLGLVQLEQYRDAEAELQFRAALATRESLLGAAHPETGLARTMLIRALVSLEKPTEAAAEGMKLVATSSSPGVVTLLSGVMRFHEMQRLARGSEHAAALALCQGLVADSSGTLGADHPLTLVLQFEQSTLLQRLGRHLEAESLAGQTIDRMPLIVARAPRMAEPYLKLGLALADRGDHAQADRYLREAERVGGAIFVKENAWGLRGGMARANWLRERGSLPEAEQTAREVLGRIPADKAILLLDAQSTLCAALAPQGKLDETLALARGLYEHYWQNRPKNPAAGILWAREYAAYLREAADYHTAVQVEQAAFEFARTASENLDNASGVGEIQLLAEFLESQGDAASAQRLTRLAIAILHQRLADRTAAPALLPFAQALLRLDKPHEAAVLLGDITTVCRETLGEDHRTTHDALLALARALQSVGDQEKASQMALEALTRRRAAFGSDDLQTHALAEGVAEVWQQQQRGDEAEPLLRASSERHAALLPASDPRRQESTLRWANLLLARKDFHAASDVLLAMRRAASAWVDSEAGRKQNWRLAEIDSRLGLCLTEQQRFDEAEPLLLESLTILRTAWRASDPRVRDAARRVVRHYEARGAEDAAARFRTLAAVPERSPSNTVLVALASSGPENRLQWQVHSHVLPDWPAEMMTHLAAGDFDGDRRDDVFYWNRLNGATRLVIRYSPQDPGTPLTILTNPLPREQLGAFTHLAAGDFDGDGLQDLFFFHTDTGASVWARSIADAGAPPRLEIAATGIVPQGINSREFSRLVAGRFQGERKAGVHLWHPQSGKSALALFDPARQSFVCEKRDIGIQGGQFTHAVAGHFGPPDGREDLFFWHSTTGANLIACATDSAALTKPWKLRPDFLAPMALSGKKFEQLVSGDFASADGTAILFFWHPESGANLAISPATSPAPNSLSSPLLQLRNFESQIAGDFNGDGRQDLWFATGR